MTAWVVLLSLAGLLVLLVSGWVRPGIAFVTLAGAYLVGGVVDISVLLQQYTNPALATLILLLLVSLALERSLLLDWVSQRLLQGCPNKATVKLMGVSAVLSAFLNNTAVVASFLGTISRQRHLAPSRLLIPLSYASILGGVTTLVGTSTNLVVSSFAMGSGALIVSERQTPLVSDQSLCCQWWGRSLWIWLTLCVGSRSSTSFR